MPYLHRGGHRIYWEEHGAGRPLLLIMGLSFPLEMWFRSIPVLAPHFRLIVFDNLGVGRSDAPLRPYSISGMAEDAVAVLDAAGVQCANVAGASMGGMIAQELALRHPHRVGKLVLGCTSFGGFKAVRPDLAAIRRRVMLRGIQSVLYGPSIQPERIREDWKVRFASSRTPHGCLAQFLGIPFWQSYARLPKLQAKTLILHGDSDLILPVENARLLAQRIPDHELVILPDAGHVFTTDDPERSHQVLLRFLDGPA